MQIERKILIGTEDNNSTPIKTEANSLAEVTAKVSQVTKELLGSESESQMTQTVKKEDLGHLPSTDANSIETFSHSIRQSLEDTRDNTLSNGANCLPGISLRDLKPEQQAHKVDQFQELGVCTKAQHLQNLPKDLNAFQKDGLTPLIKAIETQDSEQVTDLLALGAKVDCPDQKGRFPIECAIQKANWGLVKTLIKSGANVNCKCVNGDSVLYQALIMKTAKQNNSSFLEVFELMLQKGAAVNGGNQEGETPVHIAAATGQEAALRLLVQYKANVNQPSLNGSSPLHLAAFNRQTSTISLLLQLGADLNQRDLEGNSALHTAVAGGSLSTVRALLEAGIKTDYINQDGNTAAILAHSHHYQDIAHFVEFEAGNIERLWRQQKMLAHRFGIGAQIQNAGEKVELEGLNNSIVYTELLESLRHNFLGTLIRNRAAMDAPDGWKLQDFRSVSQAIYQGKEIVQQFVHKPSREKVIEQILEKIQKGEIISLPTEWTGHATGLVISGDMLIKCNRGESKLGQPGMIIYRIGDPKQFKSVFLNLLSSEQAKTNQLFFEQGMDTELKLEKVHYCPHKDQHVGNCAWASAKLVFRATLYANLRQKGLSHADADVASRKMYKNWTKKDRLAAVRQYIGQAPSKNQGFIQPQFILSRVYEKALGHPEVLKVLEPKLQGPYQRDRTGNTSLHNAIDKGKLEKAEELIDEGADLDAVNMVGDTPLHLACQADDTILIQKLIAAGASVDKLNAKGRSALQNACLRGNLEVAGFILDRAPHLLNKFTKNHSNCLMDAIQSGRSSLVKLLIKRGILINYTNSDGLTPLDIAQTGFGLEIALYLKQKGAKNSKALTS